MKAVWESKVVGAILQLEYGKPLDETDRKPDGLYPVYGANGEKNRTDKFYFDKPTMIVGRKGSAGEINLTEPKFWPLDVTYFVTFDAHQYDLRFLYYLLTTLDLPSLAKGVKPGINRNEVYSQVAKVPPLPEQRRIVGILDEAFDGIVTAKANAEKNLQNACAIYASLLETLFADSADGCEWVDLGELIDTLTDYHANGSYELLKQNVELKDTEDYAWMVRSTDFENDFKNGMRYITKSAYDFLIKSRIFGGEIIMSKIGNAGKVYLMPQINRFCSLAMNLFLIRLKEDRASNKYVYRFLKSKHGETQILGKLKGAATQTITKESVRSLQIPLLPRDIQDSFVSKLENVEAETQRLESIYKQKLSALEKLKKSLLHNAFSGQL